VLIFCIGRACFYRWRDAYRKHGDANLVNGLPANPARFKCPVSRKAKSHFNDRHGGALLNVARKNQRGRVGDPMTKNEFPTL
jgi:hypothetical protein